MSQKNIDFGSFPNDPDADAIRTAFQKVQENFDELYSGLQDQAVLSVNKSTGAGITVNSPTGNVIVTANIACVQVSTSTLSIGRNANGSQYTSITQSSQTLVVDLPANISNVTNANFAGTITANYLNANIGINTANFTATGNANLATLSVTGNANVGNIGATGVVATTLAGALTTASQPNVTGLGTLGNLTVSGNVNSNIVNANYFYGDGSNISNVLSSPGPNILNGTSNVNIPTSGGNVNTSVAGNANIHVVTGTGVNVAGTLNATGNANVANLGTGVGVFTGNVTATNVYANSGTIGASLLTGTLTTNAQPNVTSVGTLTSLAVTGNATVGNLIGPHANGNSNVNIPAANGNVNISAVGNANVLVVTGTGVNIAGTLNSTGNANVGNLGAAAGVFTGNVTAGNVYANSGTIGASLLAGTLTTAAQPNITSVGTLSALTVSGNLASGNANLGNLARANFFQGDGGLLTNISISSGSQILNGTSNVSVALNGNITMSAAGNANIVTVTGTGANVSGTLNVTGNANVGNIGATGVVATTLAGALTTASQPNITSLGTLTGLNVAGVSNLGPVGNVTITGGASGAFLKTNGSGALTWDTATLVPAQGTNTQVIFNDGGTTYAGNANLTFDKTTGNLSVGNNLIVTANITSGNANLGNLAVANFVTGTLTTNVQPNITTVGTLSALTVTGTAAANNFNATNYANAKVVSIATGTITTSNSAISVTQTWSNVSNVFTGILENITDSASDPTSSLIDLQVGGVSQFRVGKAGNVTITGTITGNGSGLSQLAGGNVTGTVANATAANTVLSNTATTTTVYPTFVSASANGFGGLLKVTGITANLGNNAITATQFVGTHVGNVVANVGNGTAIANNISISGAATGNANASTITGNLGLRTIASTYTDNSAAASATLANAAIHAIATPTLAAANLTVTSTNAATLFIQGAPIAGTNMTITNPYALYVASGGSFFTGNVSTTGTSRIQQTLEKITVSATAATGTIAFDALTQSVLYYTSNASANWTLNVRGNSTVSLNTMMNTGESLTIAFMVTNGTTAYYQNAFQVDGASVTPKWQGGTAPSAGNASSIDAYTITIIKTGSAAFTALAAQTRFA